MIPTAAQSTWLDVGGLRYHLNVWDGGGDTTVLLLHGYLDLGQNWTFLVGELGDVDWHLVAPDWRGHGDTDWIGAGGYYHFTDYVRDLHQIAKQVRRKKLVVVGHSMGAMVAIYWLGAFSELADALVLVEAVGPQPLNPSDYPGRMRTWLTQAAPFDSTEFQRSMKDHEHAERRLARAYPNIPAAMIASIARFATRENDDGSLCWKYDPLHRTRAPMPGLPAIASAFLSKIKCPALWIGGARSPWLGQVVFDWLSQVEDMQQLILPDAGHLVHNEAAADLAACLRDFVSDRLCFSGPED